MYGVGMCSVYTYIYCTLVEQMKCERARETVIIIFVRTVRGGGLGRREEGRGVGFALDISLIPGHGSLFVSRGEEYIRIRAIGEGKTCVCVFVYDYRGEVNKGRVVGGIQKIYIYIYTPRRAYSAQHV